MAVEDSCPGPGCPSPLRVPITLTHVQYVEGKPLHVHNTVMPKTAGVVPVLDHASLSLHPSLQVIS